LSSCDIAVLLQSNVVSCKLSQRYAHAQLYINLHNTAHSMSFIVPIRRLSCCPALAGPWTGGKRTRRQPAASEREEQV